MAPKNYVGNAKKHTFGNGGHILNGYVTIDKLKQFVTDKGYVKITIFV